MEKREVQKVFEQIGEKLADIKYGSITIIVQDGKVVQLETNEKIRMR